MPRSIKQLLAEALAGAKAKSRKGIIRSKDMARQHRERLVRAGWLHEIIQGWYLLSKPEGGGSSTLWHANFWSFIKVYLKDRFGDEGYCLSPEATIDLLTGETLIPNQIMVFTKKPSNKKVDLPEGKSIFLYQDKHFPGMIRQKDDLSVFPLADAIVRLSGNYYVSKPLNAELALKSVTASEISAVLLENPSVTACQRIIGAYSALGLTKTAEELTANLATVGLKLKPENPFEQPPCLSPSKVAYPFVGRIEAMWKSMRHQILENFHTAKIQPSENQLKVIEHMYAQDAYHSLSIEGYQVTEELIAKIANEGWDPDNNDGDKQQKDAMAAKGYFNAFKAVLKSIQTANTDSNNPGQTFHDDLQVWYRELLSPSVNAGLLKASSLSGFRNQPVYIQGANHVPPSKENVIPAMDKLFELLIDEPESSVRAILGHFIFVYIHPYPDGNGRIGRFLMNFMFASGGFNWTVIRVDSRSQYMQTLEEAATRGNIVPFVKFVEDEMKHWRLLLKLAND